MKYLKLFEQYKLILENSENREDCIRKYGKHLFGDEFGEGEENTDLEKELIKLIYDFTSDYYGPELNTDFVTKLKELSKCLDVYPSVLKQVAKPVFRGTEIKFRDVIKYKIEVETETSQVTIPNFIYKPTSAVSSWSTDRDKAVYFKNRGVRWSDIHPNIIFKDFIWGNPPYDLHEPDVIDDENNIPESFLNTQIPAVLECDKLDGFLFNSQKMNTKLSGNVHCNEFETFKINNDPIEVRATFNVRYIEKYKKFAISLSERVPRVF
jgi:hypothetical protein